MKLDEILRKLKSYSDPSCVEGMARFGINPKNTLGVPIPRLVAIARKAGKDHELAGRLWGSGIHEARILACMIDDPKMVTEKQADAWVKDLDSWDICDQACMRLFRYAPFAYKKAVEWSRNKGEFIRRAGFSMMATLSVGDKRAKDEQFIRLLPLIRKASTDERNYVKKAVNWALRQIGKRNRRLNKASIRTARAIIKMDSKAARWIAADALRELTDKEQLKRLRGLK